MKIISHWILTFQKVLDSAAQSLPRYEIVTGVPCSDDGVESAKEDEEFDQNGKSNDAVKLLAAVTSEKRKVTLKSRLNDKRIARYDNEIHMRAHLQSSGQRSIRVDRPDSHLYLPFILYRRIF